MGVLSMESPPPSYDQIDTLRQQPPAMAPMEAIVPNIELAEKYVQQAYLLKQQEQAINKLQRDLERAKAEAEQAQKGAGRNGSPISERAFVLSNPSAKSLFRKLANGGDRLNSIGDDKKQKSIGLQKILLSGLCCATLLLLLAVTIYILLFGPKMVVHQEAMAPSVASLAESVPRIDEFTIVGATALNELCWAKAAVGQSPEEKWCVVHRRTARTISQQPQDLFCTFAPSVQQIEELTGANALRAKSSRLATFRRRTMVILSSYLGLAKSESEKSQQQKYKRENKRTDKYQKQLSNKREQRNIGEANDFTYTYKLRKNEALRAHALCF